MKLGITALVAATSIVGCGGYVPTYAPPAPPVYLSVVDILEPIKPKLQNVSYVELFRHKFEAVNTNKVCVRSVYYGYRASNGDDKKKYLSVYLYAVQHCIEKGKTEGVYYTLRLEDLVADNNIDRSCTGGGKTALGRISPDTDECELEPTHSGGRIGVSESLVRFLEWVKDPQSNPESLPIPKVNSPTLWPDV